MLPGLLCDAALYRVQIEALADLAAVFVPDLTLDNSIKEMASRVLTVAPDRFSLAALSMGGYVAFEIMRQAPERVERLALMAASASPDTQARREERLRSMESIHLGRFVGITQRLLPQLIHAERVSDKIGQEVRAMAERVGRDAYLRQQEAILTRADSRPDLADIAVPTIVIVGQDDVLTPPSEARTIHEGVFGSALIVLPDCGHLPAMERPDEVSVLLRSWIRQ